jgi:hypothetical protein
LHDGDDADLWNNRDVVLHELGRIDEPRVAYARAPALQPG